MTNAFNRGFTNMKLVGEKALDDEDRWKLEEPKLLDRIDTALKPLVLEREMQFFRGTDSIKIEALPNSELTISPSHDGAGRFGYRASGWLKGERVPTRLLSLDEAMHFAGEFCGEHYAAAMRYREETSEREILWAREREMEDARRQKEADIEAKLAQQRKDRKERKELLDILLVFVGLIGCSFLMKAVSDWARNFKPDGLFEAVFWILALVTSTLLSIPARLLASFFE